MAAILVLLILILARVNVSGGTWCVCRSDANDTALQRTLDYACGAGADSTPILQSGACYNPTTVRTHCNYAVNSYFQRKGQASGTCDFAGTATIVTPDPISPLDPHEKPHSPPSGRSSLSFFPFLSPSPSRNPLFFPSHSFLAPSLSPPLSPSPSLRSLSFPSQPHALYFSLFQHSPSLSTDDRPLVLVSLCSAEPHILQPTDEFSPISIPHSG